MYNNVTSRGCRLRAVVHVDGVRRRRDNAQNPRENLYTPGGHAHSTLAQRYVMCVRAQRVGGRLFARLYITRGGGVCVRFIYAHWSPFTGQFGKAGNHNSPTRETLKAFPKSPLPSAAFGDSAWRYTVPRSARVRTTRRTPENQVTVTVRVQCDPDNGNRTTSCVAAIPVRRLFGNPSRAHTRRKPSVVSPVGGDRVTYGMAV